MHSVCLSQSQPAAPPTERHGWIRWLLALTLVLNLLDGIFTLFAVKAGLASEANPLMADLVTHSPLQFMASKLALVSCGIYLLWSRRTRPLAIFGSVCAFSVYALIFFYHLDGLRLI